MRALLPIAIAASFLFFGCKKSSDPASGDAPSVRGKGAKPSEPVELKVKWVVGNKHQHRLELSQSSETSFAAAGSRPIKQDLTMGQDYSLKVLSERAGGGYEIELEYGGTDMEVTMGGKPLFAYDSKGESLDDSRNPVASTFRNLDGAKVKVLLNSSNTVEKVEGTKELQERLSKGSSSQARGFLKQIFTEDYFKQMVPDNRTLPTQPVKTGDSWDAKTDIVLGPMGKTVLSTKHTLNGWEERQQRQCAVINFTGTIGPGTNATRMSGMVMSVKDGKLTGKMWFDPATGVTVESMFEQVLNAEVNMPQRANTNAAAQSLSGTSKLTQKVSIKLAEVEVTAP